jgi:hypothetical protein
MKNENLTMPEFSEANLEPIKVKLGFLNLSYNGPMASRKQKGSDVNRFPEPQPNSV